VNTQNAAHSEKSVDSCRNYCSTKNHCRRVECTVARRKYCSAQKTLQTRRNTVAVQEHCSSEAKVSCLNDEKLILARRSSFPCELYLYPASLVLKRRRLAIASSPATTSLSTSSFLSQVFFVLQQNSEAPVDYGEYPVSPSSISSVSLASPSFFIIPLIKDHIHEHVTKDQATS
jgi:hypothetical protein